MEGIKPASQLLRTGCFRRGDDSCGFPVCRVEFYGIRTAQVAALVHLYLVLFDTKGGITGVLGLYLLEGFVPNLVVYVCLVFPFARVLGASCGVPW